MQRNYFSILFFIKKTKLLKNGESPICLRITVNGKRAEVQSKRSIEVSRWNAKKECANGKERKYQELNHYLETVRTKILQIHRQLEQDGKPITAEILKCRYYGEGESPKMLLEVFNDHNKKCRDLLGKDFVLGTVLRYERTVRYLSEYMKQVYRMTDIPLKDITDEFIRGFEHYIKTNKPCSQNATVMEQEIILESIHTMLEEIRDNLKRNPEEMINSKLIAIEQVWNELAGQKFVTEDVLAQFLACTLQKIAEMNKKREEKMKN